MAYFDINRETGRTCKPHEFSSQIQKTKNKSENRVLSPLGIISARETRHIVQFWNKERWVTNLNELYKNGEETIKKKLNEPEYRVYKLGGGRKRRRRVENVNLIGNTEKLNVKPQNRTKIHNVLKKSKLQKPREVGGGR